MKAALRGKYLEVVYFMGVNETYPDWFCEELYNFTFTDESHYTAWIPSNNRMIDYYEKILVEDYSVFLRKPDGTIHVTDYDALDALYFTFRTDVFTNSGLVAFNEDVIDYVECQGGAIVSGYPDWFYEYFTESMNNPSEEETIFVTKGDGDITITEHCAVLQNKYGEIKLMDWLTFIKYYDTDPAI